VGPLQPPGPAPEAAATFIRELREDPDALNKRIIESYIAYRNSAVGYVGEAYAPVHAGRAMVAWG
jgi:hypothetical protein